MKNKLLLTLALVLSFSFSWAQPAPDFSMIGYAAMEGDGNFYNAGGTTGGAGGKIVCPKDFNELKAYAESANPYIILIDKEITSGVACHVDADGHILASGGLESTYGERLLLGSNKTLLGIGDQAFLNRIGIIIQTQSNIIIRNIKFSMRDVPISKTDENKIVAWRNGAEVTLSDPDCISIQADKNSAKVDYGHHYWIDHCEFFNGDASNKDRYDGLLDMKNNVQYTTISWCYFHDHDKACLSGKGDSDNYPRTVTMHHNYFHNIEGSRLPLQRGGFYHYFNNMQEGCSDGYDLRAAAVGYVEKCYFKDTKAPIIPKGGAATLVDLIFENCKRIPTEYAVAGVKYDKLYDIPTSDYRPPYTYTADTVADVPTIVPLNSGIGKIADEHSVSEAVDDLANTGTGTGIGDGGSDSDPELGTSTVWNFSNWTTETSFTSAYTKDGLTVTASSTVTVTIDGNSKTIGGDSYTKRLKTGGAGEVGEFRTLSFAVEGRGRLQIGVCSSSGSATRELAILANNATDTLALKQIGVTPEYVYYDYDEGEEATIYLTSKSGGINFYMLSWTPFLAPTDVKTEQAALKEAISTEYYNLNGIRLQAPIKGINIIRTIYDDGSVENAKLLVR